MLAARVGAWFVPSARGARGLRERRYLYPGSTLLGTVAPTTWSALLMSRAMPTSSRTGAIAPARCRGHLRPEGLVEEAGDGVVPLDRERTRPPIVPEPRCGARSANRSTRRSALRSRRPFFGWSSSCGFIVTAHEMVEKEILLDAALVGQLGMLVSEDQ